MKKLICLLLTVIMVLSFSACKKEDAPKDSKNDFGQEKEDSFEEGITYPILFLRDSSLYWIKDYGESPILVDEGDFMDEHYNVIVNPVNPNKIICADNGLAHEFLLNTAPSTEGTTIFSVWSEYYYNVINTSYSPTGKVFYYGDDFDLVIYDTNNIIPNIGHCISSSALSDGITYHPFYCFDDNSANFCYITDQNEIGYADIETGWYETVFSIPSEYTSTQIYKILDYRDNKMFFSCVDSNIEYNFCCFDFETNSFEIIDSAYYYTYSHKANVSYYANESDSTLSIKNKTFDVNFKRNDSDYLKIVELDDKTVLLAYSVNSGKDNQVILITDKKSETILDDSKYQFVQPISKNKLLLIENTETGTKNLVEYNITSDDFSVIYKNFQGTAKDIVVSYDLYSWIYNSHNENFWY